MKSLLSAILIVFTALAMQAQEISFTSSVIATGGNTPCNKQISFSKWRIGQVHVLTIPVDETTGSENPNWIIQCYPNPVKDILYLEFELPETREFALKVFDASGRIIIQEDSRSFVNGSMAELNLAKFPPALYLLQVTSPDFNSHQILRIQKQ